ncbi:hypothetical protein AX16_010976 [Volvariella volvacea WC 439]|nr:hypothetical protein AX16_010976 [Volvariella volvacea WC 439]
MTTNSGRFENFGNGANGRVNFGPNTEKDYRHANVRKNRYDGNAQDRRITNSGGVNQMNFDNARGTMADGSRFRRPQAEDVDVDLQEQVTQLTRALARANRELDKANDEIDRLREIIRSAGIQTNNFTNSPVISIGGNQRNPTSNYTYHGHTTHTTNLPESHKNYHDGDSFYNTTAGNGNIIGGRGNRAMNHDTPPAFDSDNEQGVGMPTRPLTASKVRSTASRSGTGDERKHGATQPRTALQIQDFTAYTTFLTLCVLTQSSPFSCSRITLYLITHMKKPTYRTADTIVSATKLALQAADALIPYLERVAALGVVIIEIAEKAKYNKTAIRNLALEVTRIFHEIQRLYKSKARNESFEDSYEQICILLDEIISYLKTLEGRGRLFRIVHGDQDATRIDEFRQRLKFQLDLLGVSNAIWCLHTNLI